MVRKRKTKNTNFFSVQKFLGVDPYACETKKLNSENEIKEKVLLNSIECCLKDPWTWTGMGKGKDV
jgi:hypothetical protein